MIGPGPARRVGLGVRLLGREIELLAVEGLSVDQVVSYREHGGLDGQPTLFAASLCLSLDGAGRIGPLGDLQGHGTPPAPRHHDTRNARHMGLRALARRNTGGGRLADGLDLD